MANILHSNAKTTPKIRQEIAESGLSIAKLAKKYNLNPKTVVKWKNRSDFVDKKAGPAKPKSSLSEREQAIICEFRRVTKLPLDDVFIALKDKIPALSRSNLYRCLKRHDLGRLEVEKTAKKERKNFKNYEVGYLHIDICTLHTKAGKAYLFLAIERSSRYVYAEIYDDMTMKTSCLFLQNIIADFPCKIHTILTDNGAQFTYKLLQKHLQPRSKIHPFDALCFEHKIEHRLTKFRSPQTNGLVERMNRTIKEATVKIFFYESVDELKKTPAYLAFGL